MPILRTKRSTKVVVAANGASVRFTFADGTVDGHSFPVKGNRGKPLAAPRREIETERKSREHSNPWFAAAEQYGRQVAAPYRAVAIEPSEAERPTGRVLNSGSKAANPHGTIKVSRLRVEGALGYEVAGGRQVIRRSFDSKWQAEKFAAALNEPKRYGAEVVRPRPAVAAKAELEAVKPLTASAKRQRQKSQTYNRGLTVRPKSKK